MSLLYESDVELDEPQRFRAATIEDALVEARAALGHDVRIVEANRIRRGGVGGFFATDLGVELVVTVGDHDPIRAELDEGGIPVDEYVDVSAPDGRVEVLPRTDGSRSDARPHFYDRMVEEDRPVRTPVRRAPAAAEPEPVVPDRLERLLASANGAERAQRATSFADHFERQMRLEAEAAPAPRANRERVAEPASVVPAQPVAEPVPAAHDDKTTPITREPLPVEPTVAVPTEEPAPVSAPPASAPVAASAPEPAAAQVKPARPRRSSTTRDPLRRPIDLAAGAVGRLVEQLSDVTPADGSRMRDLTRLVVTVTTADGTAIEIAAELEDRRD